MTNSAELPVAIIVGAGSKWRAQGPNTMLVHGGEVDDAGIPAEARWGLGGALALKFAREGHFVVLTSRSEANTAELADHITSVEGQCMTIALDVGSAESVTEAFNEVRVGAGSPQVVVYNAGYMAGRELPPEQELLEEFPLDLFEIAIAAACRGPFLVARNVLPDLRRNGGSLFFSNNAFSLRGRRRRTGESLYYPRTMMRALAQALTDEYSPLGVHVANVVIDGFIDSPGTRALDEFAARHELLVDPAAIADAFYFLHKQDRTCWTHELQLTPAAAPLSH